MSTNKEDKKRIKCKVEKSSDDNLKKKAKNGILTEISQVEHKETKRKLKKDSSDDEDSSLPKKVKKRTRSQDNNILQPTWEEYELLQEQNDLPTHIAKNIIKLFEDSNTIPFIARYRKHVTGNMSPEDLRNVKDSYDKILALKAKTQTVLKSIEKSGHLDKKLCESILGARNLEALEHIYAPFKPGGKRSLAERAKALGLEETALALLENNLKVDILHLVKPNIPELNSLKLVEKGIEHILAHAIATNADLLTFLHKLKPEVLFLLETKKAKKRETKTKVEKENKSDNKEIDESKFANFFEYKIPVKYVKPHQILAINRGEHLKVLSVKIVVPDYVFHKFNYFCNKTWTHKGYSNEIRNKLMTNAIQDSYSRLVEPLIIREIRAELKSKAEKASIDVFNGNLKQLLMANPLKGRSILGVDPGYQHGCKLGLISDTGTVLASSVVYPHKNNNKDRDEYIIGSILKEHKCSLIAIGNGTACRETESWISDMISRRVFYPLEVTYTIVSENGASIYSCSPEAKKEFPEMDPNLISAVSLARRIQEPLAELVKIEPKHLGVGMYQHDLPKKQLEQALEDVVSECVSFVGADLNTASQCLLRRIAGLSDKKASDIITYRENNGPFISRKDLLKVKGIGSAIFLQAAGFLRVGPTTLQGAKDFYKKDATTKLDCTIIHPESYKITKELIQIFKLNISDIGEDRFMNAVKNNTMDLADLSNKLKTTEENLKLIVDALSKPLNHDLRNECDLKPLFKKGLTNMSELQSGAKLTGRVDNVTHFGCFVDIGVGCNGLIHTSKLKGNVLQIGDRVEVEVLEIDLQRKRIGLQFLRKL